jgi:hypothetical protein
MTIERRPPKREPGQRTGPLELRSYVIALLAAIYAISWRAIGGHAAAVDPPPAAVAPPPHVITTIALPPGWQLASGPPSSTVAPAPHIVRAPSRHVPRVRTRSS